MLSANAPDPCLPACLPTAMESWNHAQKLRPPVNISLISYFVNWILSEQKKIMKTPHILLIPGTLTLQLSHKRQSYMIITHYWDKSKWSEMVTLKVCKLSCMNRLIQILRCWWKAEHFHKLMKPWLLSIKPPGTTLMSNTHVKFHQQRFVWHHFKSRGKWIRKCTFFLLRVDIRSLFLDHVALLLPHIKSVCYSTLWLIITELISKFVLLHESLLKKNYTTNTHYVTEAAGFSTAF